MLQIIKYNWVVEMKVKSVLCPTCLYTTDVNYLKLQLFDK